MIKVERKLRTYGEPRDVWARIGAFDAIADWHPAVASAICDIVPSGLKRTLELIDGGKITELSSQIEEFRYSYSIVDGSVPVKEYLSEFRVDNSDRCTVITWSGNFEAAGVNHAEAKAVIEEIYSAGLNAIGRRFGVAAR